MHKLTYFGDFEIFPVAEGSEMADKLRRMICQMNHPSMTGRSPEAARRLQEQLLGPDCTTVPPG